MRVSTAFIALLILATACVPYKEVLYMSDLTEAESPLNIVDAAEVALQPGDLLEINISSISLETNAYFLKPGSDTDTKSGANTYQVTSEGSVDLPLIGMVKLAGLTPSSAEELLRDRLTEYLQKPTVNVRLVSFQITVLGEVKMPGVYSMPAGKANVLEALATSGDITLYGQRSNVLLIRNFGDDKRSVRLDLRSSDFLLSENYHLQNNDVLYVPPSRGRASGDDNVYRLLPLVLSGLTFIAVIISLTQ